ncbi:sulfurtransferase [uncultured Winogradskyella sp.]|uniref:sulfurtransferase n=1 Tax=uncultured Winogradskyella sp. TaxID=395353 RepID=UPI00260EC9BD|nr:sulfurtransferase [uncultured Winogradskyella sp.]
MNWRISFIAITLVLLSCQKDKTVITNTKVSYIIEVETLKTVVDEPYIKILDFRKKEFYDNEHMQGAIHIWRTDIENTSFPYGGMMPSREQIETLFGKLGINTNDTIIVYDDNGMCESSRLWWILQYYNFKNIKLLNGGFSEWKANKGQVTTKVPRLIETEFKLSNEPKLEYFISKAEMENALHQNTVIIDTRTTDEFSGKRHKRGAFKGGRIPKSIHMDWAKAINHNTDKRLKSVEELEAIYSLLNLNKKDSIIVYCHSGVRSAHTAFVLTQLLGYKNVRNYDGSWIEWSYFDNLPFESDSITKN